MKKKVTILTPNGEGLIEDMFISELGYLMVRVFYISDRKWITYNLGTHYPNNNCFTNLINLPSNTSGEEEGVGDDDGARQGRRA